MIEPACLQLLRLHDEIIKWFSPLLLSAPQCPTDTKQWLIKSDLTNHPGVTDIVGVYSGEQYTVYKGLLADGFSQGGPTSEPER